MHQEFNDLCLKQDYITTKVDIYCTSSIIDSLFSSIILSCSSSSNYLFYKEQNSENLKKTFFEKSHIVSTECIQKIGYYYKDRIIDREHMRKILAIDRNKTISIKLSELIEVLNK